MSVVYEVESSKNAYTRGKKHLQELKAGLRINAMIIHNIAHHESPTENSFQMRVMKIVSRALDWQIKDSEADIILNSGTESRVD